MNAGHGIRGLFLYDDVNSGPAGKLTSDANATLLSLSARHILAELRSPMMWLAVALTPLVFMLVPDHIAHAGSYAEAAGFLGATTLVSWMVALPLVCTSRIWLIGLGVPRISAIVVSAAAALIPLSVLVETIEIAFFGGGIELLDIAHCYGHLVGAVVFFAVALDHLVGQPSEKRFGTDKWFAAARSASYALGPRRGGPSAAIDRHPIARTKRHVLLMIRSDPFWIMAITFYAVFTLLGPVGTFEVLSLAERAGLFAMIFAILLIVAGPSIIFIRNVLAQRGWQRHIATALASALSGLALSYPLHLLVALTVGYPVTLALVLLNYVIYTPILILASVLSYELVMMGSQRTAPEPASRAPDDGGPSGPQAHDVHEEGLPGDRPAAMQYGAFRAPILELLPAEKRAHLVSLTAEDHYVRITTEKADHLVRMRMSDAVEQAAPLKGIRIHRSAWVALCSIKSLEREGRATFAVLANGQRVRLSRAGVKLYRESMAVPH